MKKKALEIYQEELYNRVQYKLDHYRHGIWAGCFYILTGSIGAAFAHINIVDTWYNFAFEHTFDSLRMLTRFYLILLRSLKSLALLCQLIASPISILASIITITLSSISAFKGVYNNCYFYSEFCTF